MAVINVKNVSKTYGNGEIKVEALKPSSFSIERGEFVCIIGTSGSGKSTLMHLLAGVDQATSGEIFVNGKNITQLNQESLAIFRRKEVGIIYQFFNLVPVLTAKENIELPLMLDEKKVDRQYFNELVELLGIKNRIDFYPSKLSGGEQQRVAIARALIHKPSIILADEPTGNLNSKLAKEIMEFLVLASKKYNQTIVMITHDLNLARYADRIVEIQDGSIIKDYANNSNEEIQESTPIQINKEEILKRAQEKLDNLEYTVEFDEELEKWDKATGNFIIDYQTMLQAFYHVYNLDMQSTNDNNQCDSIISTYTNLFLEAMKAFDKNKSIIFKNLKKDRVVKEINSKLEFALFINEFDKAKWMITQRKKNMIKQLDLDKELQNEL